MPKLAFAVALFAVPIPLLAQAGSVPGLDITMYELTDIAFQGRRGPAYPNGEAGFMVGHSWCNAGSVNLPWVSQAGGLMVDQYPRIAFLLVREQNGRMVQVSGKSFCKHSPTAYNFQNGPCLPCNAGGGSFFYVGCSDTYGSGINSSQYALGPTTEINPWLGSWNPQGSYFDQGDPAVGGAQATDSVRSLSFQQVQAFDAVKNRMIVRETELIAGSTYYAQVQGVVKGEPVTARSNNLFNRQVSITGSGGSWSATASGGGQLGSVLTRWQGATNNMAGNGTDDGRFMIAVKVTGPTAGMYHYEYAIHNVDNDRGGASLRIPLAPGAVIANAGFRDIDADPLNDWTVAQNGNQLSFTAVGTNAIDWNTVYNCWFDCSVEPGYGIAAIDQARPGPGALSVTMQVDVPSGLSIANKSPVGAPCGTCAAAFYEFFPTLNAFDLNGRSMTMTMNGGAYTVNETPTAFVPAAGVNLGLTQNTSATVTLPFSLPYPGGNTTQLHVSSSGYVSPGLTNGNQLVASSVAFLQGYARWAPAWHTFAPTPGGNVWFDANATRAILTWNNVPSLATVNSSTFQIQFFPNGTVRVVWQSLGGANFPALTGWSPGGNQVDPGNRDLSATLATPFSMCALPFTGVRLDLSDRPVVGTTVQWQLTGIPLNTGWAALMRSLTQAVPPIDLTSSGMPGCFAHVVAPVATLLLAPGTSVNVPETIPNVPALIGVDLIGQAVSYNPPLTPLGLVASNGMLLTLGM